MGFSKDLFVGFFDLFSSDSFLKKILFGSICFPKLILFDMFKSLSDLMKSRRSPIQIFVNLDDVIEPIYLMLIILKIFWKFDDYQMVEEKPEVGQGKTTFRRFFSRFCTPFYLELATHKNAVEVALGDTIGHTICTSLAVIGGSMLASKISQRTVAAIEGLLFLGAHGLDTWCSGLKFCDDDVLGQSSWID
ncbi:gdt1-like protein 3 [Phtheirospermum japonicum]|uniref:GDT1 family protein n=1 Tax=Phtheirospermum japonicum TaxID=374723 RepID=A0A830CEB8_9LAMI|nr:gdt1-like protein 3 [Phtheirospermum japonicum]